ncbi:unnamed protein product [Rhodiola kirilowii]
MDKSSIEMERGSKAYYEGIINFIEFVKENRGGHPTHICPCRRCKLRKVPKIALDEIRAHLIYYGMKRDYIIWTSHGEVDDRPSLYTQRRDYLLQRNEESSSQYSSANHYVNPTMEMLDDAFPFRENFETGVDDDDMMNEDNNDPFGKEAYDKYHRLVAEAQTPIYSGSDITVLEAILKAMQVKVANRWSDKSFNDHLRLCKEILPQDNNFPSCYRDVKNLLRNLGLGYETIHACEHGCMLFYKEYKNLQNCLVCNEARYDDDTHSETPKKVVKYFPLTPRLQRLYMSPHIAKEMRWHDERDNGKGLRHPADGDTWQKVNMEFPDFASEVRNVRLGLSTDGFNPFGASGLSHSTWPVVVIPYNLPPSMCMRKEFNILTLLISGPKSPGKCLNIFMRPLIDELKMLWEFGVLTYDRHDGSSFMMKAAIMWTISDFPGLGMLGGLKTKGYEACPLCLDEIDANHLGGRMAYQGHRRWLPSTHHWRNAATKFNGQVERRDAPSSLSGSQILYEIHFHEFPTLSLHPKF